MSLSSRDRVKVSAALLMLNEAGADTSELIRMAEAGVSIGTPARAAYERAFNAFASSFPSFRGPLMRLGQLIEATDDRTIAGYGVALSRFTNAGDRLMLDAVMPALQSDMAAMAERTGDAGFADGLDLLPSDGAAASTDAPATHAPADAQSLPTGRDMPGWGPTGYTPSQAAPPQPAA